MYRLCCLHRIVAYSVADLGCLSRIRDPDFYPSRIPDPDLGSRIQNSSKREGWKKISCHTFFVSHKFHRIENYFILEMLKKKIWAKNYRTYYSKNCHQVLKNMGFGSGIRDTEKTNPGSRIQESKKHRIPDPGSWSATMVAYIIYLREFRKNFKRSQ